MNEIIGDSVLHHLEKHFLRKDNRLASFIYHSSVGPSFYCFAPSQELNRNYWTVVSLGISTVSMMTAIGNTMNAELIFYLPANWLFPFVENSELDDSRWPFEVIRSYYFYLLSTQNSLFDGHILPNLLSPGTPYVSTLPFTHTVLCDTSISEDHNFLYDSPISYYFIVPITIAEFLWANEDGVEQTLFEIIHAKQKDDPDYYIDFVLNPHRKCSVQYHSARELVAGLYAALEEMDEDQMILYDESSSFSLEEAF